MVSESGESDEATADPDERSLADLVGDILSPEETVLEEPVSTVKSKKKFKPKGMFLGTRRDTGEPVDVQPMVLARHA
ncbi:MAG: hypothetical protein OSA21_04875, partial [Candidatus Poseidoniaceae archaeon]|nr:hypothetical protein [Candidatus Poseidoniaceae archaeon]